MLDGLGASGFVLDHAFLNGLKSPPGLATDSAGKTSLNYLAIFFAKTLSSSFKADEAKVILSTRAWHTREFALAFRANQAGKLNKRLEQTIL